MSTRTVVVAIAFAFALGSCKKEAPPETKAAAPEEKKEEPKKEEKKDPTGLGALAKKIEEKVAATAGALAKDGKALTPAEHEALLVALAKCKLTESGIDWQCPEHKAYNEARNRSTAIKDFAGMSTSLGLKHMKHESPAVRYVAAGLLRSFFGSGTEVQDAVLKAAPEEKEPVVLAALIGAVGSAAKKNPKVGELLLKMADHEADKVQIEALGWLTSSWSAGLEGGADKVISKLEKEGSPKVQAYACETAGKLGDKRLLAIYKKLTKKPDEKPDLYSSCMSGLHEMWNPFMLPDGFVASAEAYKLTMNRLRDKPRTENRPPWTLMSKLGRVPKGPPAWYKQAEVQKVLGDIALDDKAKWLARTGCTRALGELKAQKELTAIKEKLGASDKFEDKQIVKTAEEGLAKIK